MAVAASSWSADLVLALGAVTAGACALVASVAVNGTKVRVIDVMARNLRYVMNARLSHQKDALGLFVINV
jgi:hypothetical protein